jgi:hypothetical protein
MVWLNMVPILIRIVTLRATICQRCIFQHTNISHQWATHLYHTHTITYEHVHTNSLHHKVAQQIGHGWMWWTMGWTAGRTAVWTAKPEVWTAELENGGECGGPWGGPRVGPQYGPQNPKCGPQNWTAEFYVLFLVINQFCGPRSQFCGPVLRSTLTSPCSIPNGLAYTSTHMYSSPHPCIMTMISNPCARCAFDVPIIALSHSCISIRVLFHACVCPHSPAPSQQCSSRCSHGGAS